MGTRLLLNQGTLRGGCTGSRVGILGAPLVMRLTHPSGDMSYAILELQGAPGRREFAAVGMDEAMQMDSHV